MTSEFRPLFIFTVMHTVSYCKLHFLSKSSTKVTTVLQNGELFLFCFEGLPLLLPSDASRIVVGCHRQPRPKVIHLSGTKLRNITKGLQAGTSFATSSLPFLFVRTNILRSLFIAKKTFSYRRTRHYFK